MNPQQNIIEQSEAFARGYAHCLNKFIAYLNTVDKRKALLIMTKEYKTFKEHDEMFWDIMFNCK